MFPKTFLSQIHQSQMVYTQYHQSGIRDTPFRSGIHGNGKVRINAFRKLTLSGLLYSGMCIQDKDIDPFVLLTYWVEVSVLFSLVCTKVHYWNKNITKRTMIRCSIYKKDSLIKIKDGWVLVRIICHEGWVLLPINTW